MNTSPATEAARHFLSVVWDCDKPSDETLLAALDRLVAAYHETPDVGPSDSELEAPRPESEVLVKELAARFPDYGWYPVSDPSSAAGDDAAMMGDAIDDLADITSDIREAVWLAEHVGLDDAHWCFRLHFFHWGLHARQLAHYLHARIW